MDNPGYMVEFDGHLEKPEKNGNNTTKEQSHTFEEAASLVGTGKFHYALLLIGGFCFMSVMVEILGVGLIMPQIKCDLYATRTEQGILASAGFIGVVLSSHAMGFLADTWGRVRTLRYALIFGLIATLISTVSISVWMLIIFRILNGFFISGCQACIFSYVGEFHSSRTRVLHVTILSIFLPIGVMFLPVVAMLIIPLDISIPFLWITLRPWRIFLLVNSGFSIASLFGLMFLPESPKFVLVQGRHDEAIKILQKVFSINTGKPKEDYPVKKITVEPTGVSLGSVNGFRAALQLIWNQTTPLFTKERILYTMNICISQFAIYGLAQGIFMWNSVIFNALVSNSESSLSVCEIITSIERNQTISEVTSGNSHCASDNVDTFMFVVILMVGSAFTVIYILFAMTIDLIGKRNLLIFWLIVVAICCIFVHWTSSLTFSVIYLTLIMSVGNCAGIVSTVAIEFFPTNINAMGICFIMMIGRLGAAFGSNLVGQTIFKYCDNVFWIFMAIVGGLIILAFFLPEQKKQRNKSNAI